MAMLKTIPRAACRMAFAPSGDVVAAGSASGSIDASFSTSTSLGIYSLDFASQGIELPRVGFCDTPELLHRLAWSSTEGYKYGLLAGAYVDGSIDIWNPADLISSHEANEAGKHTARLEKHQQNVRGLEFNLQSNVLASGGSDGLLCLWNVENLQEPDSEFSSNFDISCLSWNPKTSHILAAASYDGVCVVYDTKKKKPLLHLKDPKGKKRFSAVQWSPELNTHLVVALEDDTTPYLQVWDLRNSLSPLKELAGHNQGILSLSWCPHDSSLLLSCARDWRTLCWDMTTDQVVAELPRSNNDMMHFEVQWSSRWPGVFSASSFSGGVGIYNFEGCDRSRQSGSVVYKGAKWLKRPVGASFGFGGKLVTFKPVSHTASELELHTLTTEEGLSEKSSAFEAAIAEPDQKASMRTFCEQKSSEAKSPEEQEVWTFLKLALEEDGGRRTVLRELGFATRDSVETLSDDFAGKATVNEGVESVAEDNWVDDGEEFFENFQAQKPEPAPANEAPAEDQEFEEEALDANLEKEKAIERALMVGDFKSAVDHCIGLDRMADALVIAFVGGEKLWEKTHKECLKGSRSSYLKLTAAIANRDFKGLVEVRPLSAWKETLAVLCSYVAEEEFEPLVNVLAGKLELSGNVQAATLCYICAGNVEKTVEALSRSVSRVNNGKHFVDDLQELVEKSIILNIATDKKRVGPALTKLLERYVELLASQGLLETAAVYLSLVPVEQLPDLKILQDRIRKGGQQQQVSEQSPQQQQVPQQVSQQSYQKQSNYTPPQQQAYQYSQFAPPSSAQPPFAPAASQPAAFRPFTPSAGPHSRAVPAPPPAPFAPAPASQPAPFTPGPPAFSSGPAPFTPGPAPFTPSPAPFTQGPAPFTPVPQPFAPGPPQFAPAPAQFTPAPAQFTPAPAGVPPPAPGFVPVRPPASPGFVPAPASPSFGRRQQEYAAPAHAQPPPQPTVQTVDTSKVKGELRPVVDSLRRLFDETTQALGGSQAAISKKREIEDNSRKLGTLFSRLNEDEVSASAASKLIQICRALDVRDYHTALQITGAMTGTNWEEGSAWLPALRRMITQARQSLR